MSRILIALLALVSIATARTDDDASPGQTVHRCLGEHGEIVFSGVACATPAPTTRHRSEPATASAEAAVTMTCPRSASELRDVLADALARRDTNAITSLMRWDGVRGAEARDRIKEIAELGARPLIGIDLDDDAAFARDAAEPSGTLTVRTGSDGNGGPRERAFRIEMSGGCYLLDW